MFSIIKKFQKSHKKLWMYNYFNFSNHFYNTDDKIFCK